jgi:hypothetical protein
MIAFSPSSILMSATPGDLLVSPGFLNHRESGVTEKERQERLSQIGITVSLSRGPASPRMSSSSEVAIMARCSTAQQTT